MKKVTIVIPNYNGEKYISRAVESVLSQTMVLKITALVKPANIKINWI